MKNVIDLQRLVSSGPPKYISYDASPEDLTCIMYTDGTTGRPKGVMYTHKMVLTNARMIVKRSGSTRMTWGLRWFHNSTPMAL